VPYASRAQQRKFHAMESRGEISGATVREFDRSTDFSKLPERKGRKKRRNRRRWLGERLKEMGR